MVGGIVIETLDCGSRVWVNCKERHYSDTCAIYVERNDKSLTIKKGDSLWWQGGNAYWTPEENRTIEPEDGSSTPGAGTRYDIAIPRLGYSGVKHPGQALIESAFGQ